MENTELKIYLNTIQDGEISVAAKILPLFNKYMHSISYMNGKFNEDCYQELQWQLIICLQKFKCENTNLPVKQFLTNTNYSVSL